jgi:hypothetical protein
MPKGWGELLPNAQAPDQVQHENILLQSPAHERAGLNTQELCLFRC